jgi:outer membrane lipoprotein SlyB
MPLFIGCLFPLILTVVGAAVGGTTGGTTAGLWGAVAGCIVGFVLMLGVIKLFDRARDELDE